jgi:CheY-like chemotaxis protein
LIPSIIFTIPSSSFKDGFYTRVFLDLRMPKMNGFELENEIRKIDYAVKISLINAFNIQQRNLKLAVPILNEENSSFYYKTPPPYQR